MARRIYGSYRKDDFADPEQFLINLGAILERYDDEIIQVIANPTTGIVRQCPFPPSISEVVQFCDAENQRRQRIADAQGWQAAPRVAPPVILDGQDFDTLTAKHGRPIGVFELGRELIYGK